MDVAKAPLYFDSANPDALAAALSVYPGKSLTVPELQTTLLACDLLMGRDEYSMRWIKAFRKCEKAKAGQ